MRIAFMMYCFEDRAVTSASWWLGRELARRGHDVTLLVSSRAARFRFEEKRREGVRMLLSPRGVPGRWQSAGAAPYEIARRAAHLVRGGYDVLVAADCRANVYLPFRAAAGRIPLRIAYWGDCWSGEGGLARSAAAVCPRQRSLEGRWERAMMLAADGVVASSEGLVELGASWGIPPSRIVWIPHGSPVDQISVLDKASARAAAGLDGAGPVVAYVGHGEGGLGRLMPLYRRLAARYPRILFLFIGGCGEWLAAPVRAAGLEAHFRFPGFVPAEDLGTWLGCADVFLIPLSSAHPNDAYRYPGKLGEYVAAGRPVIVPDVGPTARLVRDESVGLVVGDNLESMERALVEIIEDRPLAERLGTRARRLAEERLAWPVLTDQLEAFLRRLLDAKSAA